MSNAIIISLCLLLLISYMFDVSSPKTKIPSVILLLIVGWAVRQAADFFGISIPNLSPILPIIGTVGLILIVFEGALDLELNRSKKKLIISSISMSLIPMLVLSIGIGLVFDTIFGVDFRRGLLNAVPFAVISSAIAISSAKNLLPKDREFVIYESTFSDIFAVVLFNFIIRNEVIDGNSFVVFGWQLILILVITVIATLGLSLLMSKIRHRVKFVPIILLIILIYAIAKEYHLPALIFIFILGLFIGNLDKFKRFRFVDKLQPEIMVKEVVKLNDITTEITFSIRSLFFILFGYLINTHELLNAKTFIIATGILVGIIVLRIIGLKIARQNLNPLLYVAPRGLITILLFITIPDTERISMVNNSLIIQVIVLTALFMMVGLMISKRQTR
ncbi:MAG: sodium:proton antiporter [Bacteroidetes bacterium]|nr:MAG: sodium:proton antiporter [Bacteroidota bacterium]